MGNLQETDIDFLIALSLGSLTVFGEWCGFPCCVLTGRKEEECGLAMDHGHFYSHIDPLLGKEPLSCKHLAEAPAPNTIP